MCFIVLHCVSGVEITPIVCLPQALAPLPRPHIHRSHDKRSTSVPLERPCVYVSFIPKRVSFVQTAADLDYCMIQVNRRPLQSSTINPTSRFQSTDPSVELLS